MHPFPNPPTLKDAEPKSSAERRRIDWDHRLGVLWIHCFCGAIAGAVLGPLIAPVESGARWLEHCILSGDIRPLRASPGDLLEMAVCALIACPLAGFLVGELLWLIACFWPRIELPVLAAGVCASLGGSVLLPLLAWTQFEPQASLAKCWGDLAMLAAMMALAGAFGLAHAVLTRRAIGWWSRGFGSGGAPECSHG